MQQTIAQYWIPPHVRACSSLSSTVLLDLKRNRYFGVGRKETSALSTLALNWADANIYPAQAETMPPEAAAPIAEALVEAGLLSREAPSESFGNTGCIDLDSTLTSVGYELNRSAPLRFRHITRFIRALAWARQAMRSRTLYAVARELSEQKAAAQAAFDQERAVELVGIFRRLRPHAFAAKDQCLFHALALVRFLSYHGVFATWVIGVRPKPWGAHSWVQQGTLLLDANPEHVCEFTPILVV